MAELFASTSKAPTSTSVITIGASQYFLFSLMNCQSSLTTCTFDIHQLLHQHFFLYTSHQILRHGRAGLAHVSETTHIQSRSVVRIVFIHGISTDVKCAKSFSP